MKRTFALFALLCVVAASQVAAQAPPAAPAASAVATLAASLGEVGGYLTRSAEQMPEADFVFKPTPDVRSFGQIIGHVAEVNYVVCAAMLGEKNPAGEVEKAVTTKAGLVDAVRGSFAYCERACAMSDAEAAKTVTLWGQAQPRLAALTIVLTHSWEHYGNIVTYLRLKGKVPPSSQPAS